MWDLVSGQGAFCWLRFRDNELWTSKKQLLLTRMYFEDEDLQLQLIKKPQQRPRC